MSEHFDEPDDVVASTNAIVGSISERDDPTLAEDRESLAAFAARQTVPSIAPPPDPTPANLARRGPYLAPVAATYGALMRDMEARKTISETQGAELLNHWRLAQMENTRRTNEQQAAEDHQYTKAVGLVSHLARMNYTQNEISHAVAGWGLSPSVQKKVFAEVGNFFTPHDREEHEYRSFREGLPLNEIEKAQVEFNVHDWINRTVADDTWDHTGNLSLKPPSIARVIGLNDPVLNDAFVANVRKLWPPKLIRQVMEAETAEELAALGNEGKTMLRDLDKAARVAHSATRGRYSTGLDDENVDRVLKAGLDQASETITGEINKTLRMSSATGTVDQNTFTWDATIGKLHNGMRQARSDAATWLAENTGMSAKAATAVLPKVPAMPRSLSKGGNTVADGRKATVENETAEQKQQRIELSEALAAAQTRAGSEDSFAAEETQFGAEIDWVTNALAPYQQRTRYYLDTLQKSMEELYRENKAGVHPDSLNIPQEPDPRRTASPQNDPSAAENPNDPWNPKNIPSDD